MSKKIDLSNPAHQGIAPSHDTRSLVLGGAALLASILLAGCASSGPYRTFGMGKAAPGQGHLAPNIECKGAYSVGFVELDPQGWLWDQSGRQLREVQTLIAEKANLFGDDSAVQPIILVVFVHGWKHNASAEDRNVAKFKEMLQKIAKDEQIEADERNLKPGQTVTARPVVGVYVGWPGLHTEWPGLIETSFYSRKNTADRVGYLGGITEILSRLERTHLEINKRACLDVHDVHRSFYVIVGHSFGSQVVFDALQSVMTQRIVAARAEAERHDRRVEAMTGDAKAMIKDRFSKQERTVKLPTENNDPVQPFGDMVILVNPAFEANRYQNLITLSKSFEYPPKQFPVFAIFSSDHDTATRYFFPIGRFFSTWFQNYRDDPLHDSQEEANNHTVPWIERMVTHRLVKFEDFKPAPNERPQVIPATEQISWNENDRVRDLRIEDTVLVPKNRKPSDWTPFYVVQVSEKIIGDHGDIWEDSFRDFLSYFIALPLFVAD